MPDNDCITYELARDTLKSKVGNSRTEDVSDPLVCHFRTTRNMKLFQVR